MNINNTTQEQRFNLPRESVTSKTIDRIFGRPEDYIEVHIYNQNNQLLTSIPNFTDFTQPEKTELVWNPISILNNNGYTTGKYKLIFNILRKKIFNTSVKKFVIKAISSTRTELRVIAKDVSNANLKRSSQRYINEISNSPFLRDFVLNFGNDKLITGVNLILNEVPSTSELLIKLNEPLPNNISTLSNFSINEEITGKVIQNQDLGLPEFIDTSIPLKGPNFKIDIRLNNSVPSGYKNYDQLLEYSLTSSYQNLLNKLENREIPEIQYDFIRTPSGSNDGDPQEATYNFENFVHFGSALERIKNFKYKAELLEQYNNRLNTLNSITGSTSSSIYVLENKESVNTKKTNLLKNLDGYERFLYYESGAFSWPKSNNISPYILHSISSSQVKDWLGDERSSNTNYGGQLLTASLYDRQNEHSLIRLIPNHIVENSDNSFYTTFVNMIGHHYDQIWTHIKHITETNDTHHTRGISKDLVYFSLKSLGLDTFDQFENSNLIEYILGEGNTGSIFYDAPSNQTLVTASNAGSIPKGDITKEIWKRLYHNAPYLLKTKGTERGLKALMSCYGVPSTILNVKEYGGSTTDKTKYKTFSYEKSGLALKGDSGTDGYFIKTNWNTLGSEGNDGNPDNIVNNLTNKLSSSAKTVEFRIKPVRSNNNYHLWSLSGSDGSNQTLDQHLILEPYAGADISSSGDANQYGRLKWSTSNHSLVTPTEYFPVYNGDFWNIFIGIETELDDNTQTNKRVKFGAYQANYLKTINSYVTSSEIRTINLHRKAWGLYLSGSPITHEDNAGAAFCFIGGLPAGEHNDNIDGLKYSGSIQEVRYHFGELLTHETLKKHALEPFMYSGNSVSSSYNNLVLRLPLGSNDKRDSGSYHPNLEVDYLNYQEGNNLINNNIWRTDGNLTSENIINDYGADVTNITAPPTGFRFQTVVGSDNTNNPISIQNHGVFTNISNNAAKITYTITNTNHDSGLAVFNVSGDQRTLDTTLGDHLLIFDNIGTNNFVLKRRVAAQALDITVKNIIITRVPESSSNMSNQSWEEVVETHHLPTPDTVGISTTSEKTRIDTGTIDDNWLSPTRKTETSTLDRQPLDYPDLGVFFSPTTEINEDILYTLGSFRLDDYIGSPLPSAQSSSIYENLSDIKDIYFKKVKRRYNYWDYVKLIQYIDHTLFKLVEQWVPMKANLKTGLLIEPHYLERTKFAREIPTTGVGQSMLNNSYQTFEFELDPDNSFSFTGSAVIVTNNLLQSTGSNGQRKEQGTNGSINIKGKSNLEGSSVISGVTNKGRISSRYYRRLINNRETRF